MQAGGTVMRKWCFSRVSTCCSRGVALPLLSCRCPGSQGPASTWRRRSSSRRQWQQWPAAGWQQCSSSSWWATRGRQLHAAPSTPPWQHATSSSSSSSRQYASPSSDALQRASSHAAARPACHPCLHAPRHPWLQQHAPSHAGLPDAQHAFLQGTRAACARHGTTHAPPAKAVVAAGTAGGGGAAGRCVHQLAMAVAAGMAAAQLCRWLAGWWALRPRLQGTNACGASRALAKFEWGRPSSRAVGVACCGRVPESPCSAASPAATAGCRRVLVDIRPGCAALCPFVYVCVEVSAAS